MTEKRMLTLRSKLLRALTTPPKCNKLPLPQTNSSFSTKVLSDLGLTIKPASRKGLINWDRAGRRTFDQSEIEEEPLATSPTQQTKPHWTAALKVSAREVEEYNLHLVAPSFPFKQGWDGNARKEIKARASRTVRAAGTGFFRRHSYDG